MLNKLESEMSIAGPGFIISITEAQSIVSEMQSNIGGAMSTPHGAEELNTDMKWVAGWANSLLDAWLYSEPDAKYLKSYRAAVDSARQRIFQLCHS